MVALPFDPTLDPYLFISLGRAKTWTTGVYLTTNILLMIVVKHDTEVS